MMYKKDFYEFRKFRWLKKKKDPYPGAPALVVQVEADNQYSTYSRYKRLFWRLYILNNVDILGK
jgi:hypothetical protein